MNALASIFEEEILAGAVLNDLCSKTLFTFLIKDKPTKNFQGTQFVMNLNDWNIVETL